MKLKDETLLLDSLQVVYILQRTISLMHLSFSRNGHAISNDNDRDFFILAMPRRRDYRRLRTSSQSSVEIQASKKMSRTRYSRYKCTVVFQRSLIILADDSDQRVSGGTYIGFVICAIVEIY